MSLDNKKELVNLYDLVKETKIIYSEQFIPWNKGNMEGLYRKLIFSRNTLLGEVSKYFAEDYILWKYIYPEDYQKIKKQWAGKPDTFLSRFIFLHPSLPFSCKRKSIWLGVRGYVDLIICQFPLLEQDLNRAEIRDITSFLIGD